MWHAVVVRAQYFQQAKTLTPRLWNTLSGQSGALLLWVFDLKCLLASYSGPLDIAEVLHKTLISQKMYNDNTEK